MRFNEDYLQFLDEYLLREKLASGLY